MIRKRRGLGEDQDAHLGGGFEDVGDVLTAGGVAVGGAGPGGEGVGEGGGGGGDVGVALGDVGLVGLRRRAEVGAEDSPLGESLVEPCGRVSATFGISKER